jgi:hypothetical protein
MQLEQEEKEKNGSAMTPTHVILKVPADVILMLKREFVISDESLEVFVVSVIEKAIQDRIGEQNAKVFNEAETIEMEDDLKGLGYI